MSKKYHCYQMLLISF